MRLVDDDHPDRIKCTERVTAHTKGLNHPDDKRVFEVTDVTLYPTDRRTWAKLSDTLDPLIGQKFFVDDDERPGFHMTRDRKSGCRFAHPGIERQNTLTGIPVQGGLLVVAKPARKLYVNRDGFRS
jgi:hypothetical protein